MIVERWGAILDRWFGAVLRTYPADAHEFLGHRADRFANPVGTTTRKALGGLLDGLAADDAAACIGPLEEILRIRAVQDFPPSRAVGFVLDLKRILREDLADAGARDVPAASLAAWDESVDRLALVAFDVYVAFRERVFELRSAEWKNRMFRLLQKAGLVGAVDDHDDEEAARDHVEGVADGDDKPRGGS